MTVADFGCGVGGPARNIAKFSGCSVVGLNNNAYQVQRAALKTAREGLGNQVTFVQGDFMQPPFPEVSGGGGGGGHRHGRGSPLLLLLLPLACAHPLTSCCCRFRAAHWLPRLPAGLL